MKKVLAGLDEILNQEKPALLLVHGDTTTTMAASLSAFYHHVPIGHVEAGLWTWNLAAPFPKEANRQLTDDLTTLYFAPLHSVGKICSMKIIRPNKFLSLGTRRLMPSTTRSTRTTIMRS